MTKRRMLVIGAFLAFGLAAGFGHLWFYRNTDSILPLDLPGYLLGEGLYAGSIRLLGDPGSAQAHLTVPWLLRIPQVHLLASTVLWGALGALGAFLLRVRVLAAITGAYAFLAISFTIFWFLS